MKREHFFLQVISGLLIILFFYTGVMKLIDRETFVFDLINAPIISKVSTMLYTIVPAAEIITALMLLFSRTQKIGLWSSFILMILFTIYVGGILIKGGHRPCTCGGVIRAMTWEQHLIFNIFFTVLALFAIILLRKIRRNEYEKSELTAG